MTGYIMSVGMCGMSKVNLTIPLVLVFVGQELFDVSSVDKFGGVILLWNPKNTSVSITCPMKDVFPN